MTATPIVKPAGTTAKKRNPTIEDFNFPEGLPTANDLPCSDDQPVDNILQEILPALLKAILMDIWKERTDWLFGIDLGFYYDSKLPVIVPDAMLCLGLREDTYENCRPSYVLWEEKVIPTFVMEIVSGTPGGERTKKMEIYKSIGILYYLIYAPLLKRKAKFQLYKLIEGEYVLQNSSGSPYWMPEVSLGIGTEVMKYGNLEREWLVWYDEAGVRYPTSAERNEAERSLREAAERQAEAAERQAEIERSSREAAERQAEAAERQAEMERSSREAAERENALLKQRLQELGIDPDATKME